jgi:outer membrane protein assembly factor BamB
MMSHHRRGRNTNMARSLGLLCTFFVLLVYAADLSAQEWPRFRGPNGSGLGPAVDVPSAWTDKDYAWKVKLAGAGYSSPVLWGDKIFVTAGTAERRLVLCIDARDGHTLWTHDTPGSSYRLHKRNSYATSTPAADDRHVYVCWVTPAQFLVSALDHKGHPVWEKDLGSYPSQHGFGASPIVFDDMVIVAREQDGNGILVALDSRTGSIRWQVPRHGKNATYSTPCVYQPPGQAPALIFTNWQHGITAVDPHSGKVAWETSVFEPEKQERAIASPVVAGDLGPRHMRLCDGPEAPGRSSARGEKRQGSVAAGEGRRLSADAAGEGRPRVPGQRAGHF